VADKTELEQQLLEVRMADKALQLMDETTKTE
jgi:hypothetical protein